LKGQRVKFIKPYKKQIAPRLASGDSRENWGGRLPEDVKYALYLVARRERKSVSWLMEEIVLGHFGFKTPDYLKPKPKPTDEAKKHRQSQDLAEAQARDTHRKRSAALMH
jgi:hypothetical protein